MTDIPFNLFFFVCKNHGIDNFSSFPFLCSVDELASIQWKASKARLRLRHIKQGFEVQPPLNMINYVVRLLIWLARQVMCLFELIRSGGGDAEQTAAFWVDTA